MKKLFLILFLIPALAPGGNTTKSHVRGHGDGEFFGGIGSSHKGGEYRNKRTINDYGEPNHYRDRKGGTPT